MKIFLVGMPGAGKSTLAPMLARRLEFPCIDLDEEIAHAEGMALLTIFQTKGSDYFRQSERRRLIVRCHASESFVMSTGGGAPCFFDNMACINAAGISVFLDVAPLTLLTRLQHAKALPIPLLSDEGQLSLERIAALRAQRQPFYTQARYTIGEPIDADRILALIGAEI